MRYPYAYFKGKQLGEDTGQRGYPHAALFNPQGEIVWTGHPSSLRSSTIKEHLKGASKYVTFGWGEKYKKVAKAIFENEFAKALAETDKLGAKGNERATEVRASIEAMLTTKIEAMNDALEKGDYYAANSTALSLKGNLKGLDEASASVDAVFALLKSDKNAKTVLKGQTSLQKLADGELRKRKQIQTAMDKAKKLKKQYADTIVEQQADAFLDKLRVMLNG